jgi:hypothetical protein
MKKKHPPIQIFPDEDPENRDWIRTLNKQHADQSPIDESLAQSRLAITELTRANEDQETIATFHQLVNMSPSEIEAWLETEESTSVGQKPEGGGESIGHRSGRRILAILRKSRETYTADDLTHMRKVISYISRHTGAGQRPQDNARASPWRYSLMNWGHDPLK